MEEHDGTVLGGCRIEGTVGRGGMGVVYRARQLELDRVVALKVISPERIEDPSVRDRFLGEARAAAAVEHPNVLPVYGAGVEDGQAFLVMRHVPGQDLRTLVRTEGPLELARAAEICVALGGALDAIHASGYVHRDVKPANVLLDTSGHVYLTDFGLAKHALTDGGMTDTGRWVGTLDFAAPEQIRGEAVDARTDVYALGAVLFFMVCGRVPFERDSDPARLFAHLNDAPPRASAVRPGVPAAMDAVIARALAKEPASRYEGAGELGRAAAIAAGRPDLSGSATRISRRPRRHRRLPRAWLLAALALLAVAATSVLLLAGDDPAPRTSPAPTPTPTPAASASKPEVTDVARGLGFSPRSVVVAGGSVWVMSSQSRKLARFDTGTGDRRPVQKLPAKPWAMAGDDEHVWVAVPSAMAIYRFDLQGRIDDRIRTPLRPVGVAVSGDDLWIAGRRLAVEERPTAPGTADTLYHYDVAGERLGEQPLASGFKALTGAPGAAYVLLWDSPRVMRIGSGRRERRNLDLAGSSLVFGEGRLWVTTAGGAERFSSSLGTKIVLGLEAQPSQAAILDALLYVTIKTRNELAYTEARRGTEFDERRIPVATNPVAIASGEDALWVASVGGGGTLQRVTP